MDAAEFIINFQDHLAQKLDVYEQAIYLYVYRHTRLVEKDEAVIGFKSARRNLAFGVGKRGSAIAEHVMYEKLRSLQEKGCIKILRSEHTGTRLRLFLPNEIAGLVPLAEGNVPFDIEAVDFFEIPDHREAILHREQHRCFYCLRKIDSQSYVIEHVISRPVGDNSYRNVVAACRQCNNRKGAAQAEEFLRILYREGLLSQQDLNDRMSQLNLLRQGDLKPVFPVG